MARIPNEDIVDGFSPRDKQQTLAHGGQMVAAGVEKIEPSNFLTQQALSPSPAQQIGFKGEEISR